MILSTERPPSHRSSSDEEKDLEQGVRDSFDTPRSSSCPQRHENNDPAKRGALPQKSTATAPALDWEGPDDPANPHNWSRFLKIYHTFIPAAIALVCTIASSIITPGFDDIQREFGVSAEVSLLPFVLYVLGLACGPLLAGPCSEHFGRRAVYMLCIPVFALFTLGAGFSQSIGSLTVCRFLAGVFGSPGLTIGGATLSDIWLPAERAVPWAVYVTTPFLGPAIGPLIGGFVTSGKGWRWTQWTILFFAIVGLVPTLWMKETYKPMILHRKAKASGIPVPGSNQTKLQAVRRFVTKLLTRPIHMALVEPVVGLFTLYIALNFGMLYAFFAAFPYVFAEAYDFGIESTGLTFLGLGVGSFIGCGLMILFSRFVFRPQVNHSKELGHGGKVAPEKRLYLAMIGSVCLPVSLFWFGWSVQAKVHWICPIIAEGVFGCGNLLVFMAATLYMIDFYGPLYGASANGATALARYTLGAVFPLFIVQMYMRLGTGWATSLLGFISLALTPIPWVFYRIGPKLREKSRYIKVDGT